jgi:hypothetical protein
MAGSEWRIDAFIFYSHTADGRLAPILRQALERLTKPWYRRRARTVPRHVPHGGRAQLADDDRRCAERARSLVVLCSPQAAASPWVDEEVRWWPDTNGLYSRMCGLVGRDFTAAEWSAYVVGRDAEPLCTG